MRGRGKQLNDKTLHNIGKSIINIIKAIHFPKHMRGLFYCQQWTHNKFRRKFLSSKNLTFFLSTSKSWSSCVFFTSFWSKNSIWRLKNLLTRKFTRHPGKSMILLAICFSHLNDRINSLRSHQIERKQGPFIYFSYRTLAYVTYTTNFVAGNGDNCP